MYTGIVMHGNRAHCNKTHNNNGIMYNSPIETSIYYI